MWLILDHFVTFSYLICGNLCFDLLFSVAKDSLSFYASIWTISAGIVNYIPMTARAVLIPIILICHPC